MQNEQACVLRTSGVGVLTRDAKLDPVELKESVEEISFSALALFPAVLHAQKKTRTIVAYPPQALSFLNYGQ